MVMTMTMITEETMTMTIMIRMVTVTSQRINCLKFLFVIKISFHVQFDHLILLVTRF